MRAQPLGLLGRVPRRLIWDNEPGIGRGQRRAEGVTSFMGTLAAVQLRVRPSMMKSVGMVEWFMLIDGMLHADRVPSWADLGAALGLPDQRWRAHDPRQMPTREVTIWQSLGQRPEHAGVPWLGIADFGDRVAVDPIGCAELDTEDFPRGLV